MARRLSLSSQILSGAKARSGTRCTVRRAAEITKQAPAPQPIRQSLAPAPVNVSQPEPKSLALPELQISGHMYMAEGSASNRLFANGGSFRQGDKLDNHWTLIAVGIDGIEISAGQRREFVPYR